jgi:hypothetical protein
MKWILEKYGIKMRTGLKWLITVYNAGFCEHINEPSGFSKAGNFLTISSCNMIASERAEGIILFCLYLSCSYMSFLLYNLQSKENASELSS